MKSEVRYASNRIVAARDLPEGTVLTADDVNFRVPVSSKITPATLRPFQIDKIVGKRGLDAITAVKPNVASVSIDAPHLLLQRNPKEAVAAIEKFLLMLQKAEMSASLKTE